MNKTIIWILGFVFAIGIFSCRKDVAIPDPNADPDCYDFERNGGISNSVFAHEPIQFKTPCYNPLNSDEFVYYYRNTTTGENKLIKFNFTTGLKTIIVDTFGLISQPSWSKTGWIAFDKGGEYKIWIVKENGDSLHSFSSTGADLYPTWDSSGKELYWMHSPTLAIPYYGFRKSLYNSSQEDTVYFSYLKNMCSSENNNLLAQIYVGSTPYIAKSSLGSSLMFSPIVNIGQLNSTSLEGICWHPNGQDFYFTIYNDGLYKCNASTGLYFKIMDFCNSKMYAKISCSPDGQYLLGERVKYWVDNPEEQFWIIKVQTNIYRINLNTMEETLINLE